MDKYKKDNILYFRNILDDDTITADAIKDSFESNKAADTDAGINYDDFIAKD